MAPPAPALRRVALVTGAAQGIGRSIAMRLAKDGLDVAAVDLQSKRKQLNDVVSEIRSRTGGRARAIAVTANVASEHDVQAMTASVVGHLGSLDVVSCLVLQGLQQMMANTSSRRWLPMQLFYTAQSSLAVSESHLIVPHARA